MKSVFKKIATITFIALFTFSVTGLESFVYAAPLSSLSDTLSTVKTSTLASHTIQFITPVGVTAGQTMTITFPAGFTMGTFNINNIDLAVSSGGTCSSFSDRTVGTSASGTTWGVAQASQVITITSGTDTIAANRCVQVEIGANATTGTSGTNQITNPSSANTYSITIAGTFGDTGSILVPIITDDQVQVSATVDQTISFALSGNSIAFGSLSSSATRYANSTTGSGTEVAAHTMTASTNATSGYTVTATGATLTSGANTITPISGGPTALSTGTEQFGIRATVSGGSGASVATTYAGTTGNYGFSTTPTVPTSFASATGATATNTYSVFYAANAAATTEAGTYTTAITYVASANF